MKKTVKYSLASAFLLVTLLSADAMTLTNVEAQYTTQSKVADTKGLEQSINAGFSRTSGNTDTLNLTGKYDINFTTVGYDDEKLKTAFDASVYLTENDNVKDNEEYTANLGLEQIMGNDSLGYMSINWLRNKFLNYDNKLSLGLGVGKELFNDNKHTLKFKVGTAYNIEHYANNQETERFGSLNEYLEYNNKLNQISSFYLKVGSMQNFDDFSDDHEMLSVVGFSFNVGDNLSLSLAQEMRYDTLPPVGFKKTDLKSLVRVGYHF